jgi:hypothetical protein
MHWFSDSGMATLASALFGALSVTVGRMLLSGSLNLKVGRLSLRMDIEPRTQQGDSLSGSGTEPPCSL